MREYRDPKCVAKKLHDWYEKYSKEVGWTTQTECQVEYDTLPEKNRQVMEMVASEVIDWADDNFSGW